MTKFIFVMGGVVSGIGKGIVATSLGRLLKNRGLKVFLQKFDPYINVDPGTMSPYQHGEVFVTRDGAETDLDLGHYERFIDEELTQNANITTGRVYLNVITKERRGDYLGATVQVVPHITDEIKQKIYDAARESKADVVITEIGGTVGDIESTPFIEAVRQFVASLPRQDAMILHTALIPNIPGSNELKTKPIQHSYKELMSLGLRPDVIITRCDYPITEDIRAKIALFCDVKEDHIIESTNVDLIYELPLILHRQNFDQIVCDRLDLSTPPCDMEEWKSMVEAMKHLDHEVTIALVGKYVELHDAYLSVMEALKHAGALVNSQVHIKWVDAQEVTFGTAHEWFKDVDGILVPGGFGQRGVEGMIVAAQYARLNQIPYFGICLGMQIACIEFSRNVCGLSDANSMEFDENCDHPVISLMADQDEDGDLGGTLRLGNWPCHLKAESKAHILYQADTVDERHRHRYEFNNSYRDVLTAKGFVFSGTSPDGHLVEIVELKDHPYFVACQFHPEFKSRPNRPHPLFCGFVEAAFKQMSSQKK